MTRLISAKWQSIETTLALQDFHTTCTPKACGIQRPYRSGDHRIKNHKMIWGGRDHKDHLMSTPLMGREFSLDRVAQNPIQPGLAGTGPSGAGPTRLLEKVIRTYLRANIKY